MELSRFTDYSLRALVYVGLHQQTLATTTGIAEAYDISKNHVVKVVHKLAQHGFLKTYQGRSGGLELGRDPDQIRVGDVVRVMESMNLVECFDPEKGDCCIFGACELKNALRRAHDAFLASLDDYTIADLLAPSRKLGRILGVSAKD
ncbi:MAG: Rrf2 family transcriptional regulator [Planctomycetota bacterium]